MGGRREREGEGEKGREREGVCVSVNRGMENETKVCERGGCMCTRCLVSMDDGGWGWGGAAQVRTHQ